jgi:hypothetical protein
MSVTKPDDDSYSETEIVARREATLKRMLAMPHKPQAPLGKRKPVEKPHGRQG